MKQHIDIQLLKNVIGCEAAYACTVLFPFISSNCVKNLFITSSPTTKEFSLNYSKEQQITIDLPEEGISLELVEKETIRKVLEQTHWNLSKAAKLLGITRDTLRYRIRKHQLAPHNSG